MKGLRASVIWGLAGFVGPTLIVFLAYPLLIHGLGQEVFGVYVLATSIGGVFAFLDLGTTSATTKFVAQYENREQHRNHLADIVTASLLFNFLGGAIVALLIFASSPSIYSYLVKSPVPGVDGPRVLETAAVQFVLFALISVVISALKGLQRFGLAALVLIGYSAFFYGGSLLGTLASENRLFSVMVSAATGTAVALLIALALLHRVLARTGVYLLRRIPGRAVFREILGFSAVMSINTIAGTVLFQMQRYVAGAFIGVSAVTIFFIPFSLASKGHALVNSANEVLYPYSSASRQPDELRKVYLGMLGTTAITSAIGATVLILFADPILRFWVGPDIAAHGASLLKILAIGFFFLAITPPPFHLFNGLGKPLLNTGFALFNAGANVVLLLAFFLINDKLDLVHLAWAFTLANALNAVGYHVLAERLVWTQIHRRVQSLGS